MSASDKVIDRRSKRVQQLTKPDIASFIFTLTYLTCIKYVVFGWINNIITIYIYIQVNVCLSERQVRNSLTLLYISSYVCKRIYVQVWTQAGFDWHSIQVDRRTRDYRYDLRELEALLLHNIARGIMCFHIFFVALSLYIIFLNVHYLVCQRNICINALLFA